MANENHGSIRDAPTINPLVAAVESIEKAPVLDPTINKANAAVDVLLPKGVLRNLLRGAPLGHPAHPIAVLVPAGAWASSAVLDFVPGQQRAARTLVGLGLLGAAPAAAAGIADWSELQQRQQRVGVIHWAANVVAIALYSVSYLERRRGRNATGKLFGLAGMAVLGVSGYLGGHLAYRQAANVVAGEETLRQDS